MLRLNIKGDTLTLICNHLESNKLDAHDKEVYEGLLKSPEEQNVKSDSKYLLHKLADAVAIRGPQADSVAQVISRQSGKYCWCAAISMILLFRMRITPLEKD